MALLGSTRNRVAPVGKVAAMFTLMAASLGASDSTPPTAVEPRTYRLDWYLTVDGSGQVYARGCAAVPRYEEARLVSSAVDLGSDFLYNPARGAIVLPIAVDGAFFDTDLNSLKATALIKDSFERGRGKGVDGHSEFGATADERYVAWSVDPVGWLGLVDFRVQAQVTCYNAKIDEAEAMRLAHPDEWPAWAAPMLRAEAFIESDDETVRRWAAGVLNGRDPRTVAPYLAAKAVLQKAVREVRRVQSPIAESNDWAPPFSIDPDGRPPRDRSGGPDRDLNPTRGHVTGGLRVKGAKHLLEHEGDGTALDAICLFVAACRALDIPARPVVGFDTRRERADAQELVAWAEIGLPEIGWAPVDVMRFVGAPGYSQDVQSTWPGFGSDDDLNRKIPLAYRFTPSKEALTSADWPLIWGTSAPTPGKVAHQAVVAATRVETTTRRSGR